MSISSVNESNIDFKFLDLYFLGQMEKSSNVTKYDKDFQINLQQWQPKSKGKLDDSKHFDALCHNSNTPIQNRVMYYCSLHIYEIYKCMSSYQYLMGLCLILNHTISWEILAGFKFMLNFAA